MTIPRPTQIASADFVNLATTEGETLFAKTKRRLAKKSGDPRLTGGHRQVAL